MVSYLPAPPAPERETSKRNSFPPSLPGYTCYSPLRGCTAGAWHVLNRPPVECRGVWGVGWWAPLPLLLTQVLCPRCFRLKRCHAGRPWSCRSVRKSSPSLSSIASAGLSGEASRDTGSNLEWHGIPPSPPSLTLPPGLEDTASLLFVHFPVCYQAVGREGLLLETTFPIGEGAQKLS